MLVIQNLVKRYGALVAVDDLSLTLQDGEIFGFIGPNGAGKSTTVRAMLGFIQKDRGEVYFNNEPLTPDRVDLKAKIGYLPSEITLYESLTGRKMIEYNKRFYKNVDDAYVQSLIERLRFDDSKQIESYSLGNRKKLGIILCLMHDPSLIIMDEATGGLDPLIQEEFYGILREEKAKGKTIFFSSHYLEEVKKLCDRIGVIKQGKLIKVDRVENITSEQGVHVTLFLKKPLTECPLPKASLSDSGTVLKCYHSGEKSSLLSLLSDPNVERFLIEEPSIEEVFRHLYE